MHGPRTKDLEGHQPSLSINYHCGKIKTTLFRSGPVEDVRKMCIDGACTYRMGTVVKLAPSQQWTKRSIWTSDRSLLDLASSARSRIHGFRNLPGNPTCTLRIAFEFPKRVLWYSISCRLAESQDHNRPTLAHHEVLPMWYWVSTPQHQSITWNAGLS